MTTDKTCVVCKVACVLVIIGALNLGLMGLLKIDLIAQLLGGIPKAVRLTYLLIGAAGVAKLIACFKDCPACKK